MSCDTPFAYPGSPHCQPDRKESRQRQPGGGFWSGDMRKGAEAPAEVRGGRAGGSCQPDQELAAKRRFRSHPKPPLCVLSLACPYMFFFIFEERLPAQQSRTVVCCAVAEVPSSCSSQLVAVRR
jgi:hypothetical protein